MMTRRTAAKGAALTALSYSRVLGANDRIGLGVIGTGGRGTYVMTRFQTFNDVEVRALCDVYPARIDEALDARTVGLGLDRLRAAATAIFIVAGESKHRVARAVVTSGLCSVIVTDEATAHALLEETA